MEFGLFAPPSSVSKDNRMSQTTLVGTTCVKLSDTPFQMRANLSRGPPRRNCVLARPQPLDLSLFLLENSFPDIMSLYFSFNVVYEQVCN